MDLVLLDVDTLKKVFDQLPPAENYPYERYRVPLISEGAEIEFQKRRYTDGSVRWTLPLQATYY